MAVEATERTTVLKKGQTEEQPLLIPDVEVDSWWTNLSCGVKACVSLYHAHGTSEQFHSEFKSDLGLALLPSGSMRTNSLILGLAALAFNCLRRIGQTALANTPAPRNQEKRHERLRLRTVLLDFIKVACKVISHAGETILKFGRNCFNFPILKKIYALC